MEFGGLLARACGGGQGNSIYLALDPFLHLQLEIVLGRIENWSASINLERILGNQ